MRSSTLGSLICPALGMTDGKSQKPGAAVAYSEWPAGGVLGLGLEEGAAHCVKVHAGGGRIALGALRLRQHLSGRLGSRYVINSLQCRRIFLLMQDMRTDSCFQTPLQAVLWPDMLIPLQSRAYSAAAVYFASACKTFLRDPAMRLLPLGFLWSLSQMRPETWSQGYMLVKQVLTEVRHWRTWCMLQALA